MQFSHRDYYFASRNVDPTAAAHAWKSLDVSWEAVVGWFRDSAAREPVYRKSDLGLVSFAKFENGASKAHVQWIDGVFLDYDDLTYEQMVAVLANARRFRGLAYTSYHHGLKGPDVTRMHRIRLAFPLSDRATPTEWEGIWYQVQALIGLGCDQNTKDISRGYVPPGTNVLGQRCWFDTWEGETLQTRDLLTAAATAIPLEIEDLLDQSELLSDEDLGKLATKLSKSSTQEFQKLSRSLRKMLLGEPFAAENYRHPTLYKLAGEIAEAFPHANARAVAERFAVALETTDNQTVETFTKQIQAQQHKHQRKERELAQVRNLFLAPPSTPSSDAYATISRGTSQTHPDVSGVVEGIPLIVQRNGHYWLRNPRSRDFIDVYGKDDVRLALHRHYGALMQDAEGNLLKLEKICNAWSWVADKIVGDYNRRTNDFDISTRTLSLATARKREVPAVRHLDVEEWLQLLAGPRFDKVIQWLRGLAHLDKPAPALYLYGKSGAGKNLLAHGVAACWENQLVRYEDIERYSGPLRQSPVVYADEGLPPKVDFAWFRSLITTKIRRIRDPYEAHFDLHGYIRLIVSANNFDLFKPGRISFTQDDADAIARRFLPIKVGTEAVDFLEALPISTDEFRLKIPEYIQYLVHSEGRVDPRGRFVVKSETSDIVDRVSHARYPWFVELLINYLENPLQLESQYTGARKFDGTAWLVRTKDQKLLVSWRASSYLNERLNVDQTEFRRACRFFAVSETQEIRLYLPGSHRNRVSYYEIDLEKLIRTYGESFDVDSAVETLGTDSDVRIPVV